MTDKTALLFDVEVRSAYILPLPDPTSGWDLLGQFGLVWFGLYSTNGLALLQTQQLIRFADWFGGSCMI